MANFATEAGVRLKFQLNDTTFAPSELVTASIDAAHLELVRRLNPEYDTTPAEDGVVLGETLLSGSHLLRSLASKDASEQKHVVIGGQRIEAGKRFSSLMAMALLAEEQAWRVIEPYLLDRPPRSPLDATDTVAVLGEE